ncbi:MAG: site-specific integrase [Peptococcaceae bacterium]|jgi:integrase|nr:site-specific integrase [Peptococcaceae bacterium]
MAKRRPNGDGLVRKRDDGRWEGRIVVGHKNDGNPIYRYVFGGTQKELLEKLHGSIENYRDAELTEDCKMSLGEWLNCWMNEYALFTVRESTWKGYRTLLENYVKPYLGEKPLAFLTTADIQKMYNKVKLQGRVKNHPIHGHQLADSMVRKIHMLLHEALDAAVNRRLLVKNPTNGTTIPKNNYAPKQILNDAQLDHFLKAVQGDDIWRDFFYTELTTGLRRGEICGLKWQDFDTKNGVLNICRTLHKDDGGYTVGETKTGAGTRTIILPPSTAELMHKRKQTAVGEWIFHNPVKPEEPVNPDSAYRRMKTLLKKAELPSIRFHDLRHTFSTHALAGGVDAKTLSGILGHTNASFTLDTYACVK